MISCSVERLVWFACLLAKMSRLKVNVSRKIEKIAINNNIVRLFNKKLRATKE